MKKFLKLFICALTLVVGCGVALANPTINVVNAVIDAISVTNAHGSFSFTVKDMVSYVNAKEDANKDKFFIPFPDVTDGATDVTVNVKVGSNVYDYVVDSNNADEHFAKTTVNGVEGVVFKYTSNVSHQVYFTAKLDDKTYSSSIYPVVVEGVTYSFDLTLSEVIPTISGLNDKIYVPTLKVLDANGNDQEVDIVPVATKNGRVSTDLKVAEDGKYYLTPSSYGTYTISYKSSTHRLSSHISLTVADNFDSSKVELKTETLAISGVELGKETILPKPVVTDTHHDIKEVATNVKISIYDNKDNLVKTLKENSYKVIFNKAGNYKVKYEITDMYLNNDNDVEPLNIEMSEDLVVTDTTNATVSFAKNYTAGTTTAKDTVIDLAETQTATTSWEDSVVIEKDYILPTRVGYNEMTFPAIYASDLGVAYENMEFERTLVYANKIYNIDSKTDNAKLTEDNTDFTKAIDFEFVRLEDEIVDDNTDETLADATYSNRIARTYTLVYKVKDKTTGNEIGRKEVEFTVLPLDVDVKTEDTNITIALPTNIKEEIASDEVISVNMNKSSYGAKISDDEDERIETHYYYYYGEKSLVDDAFVAAKGENEYAVDFAGKFNEFKTANDLTVYELEHTNNIFDIKLGEEYNSETVFTVVAVAINDQGQFVLDSKQISVIDTTSDPNVPTISVSSETEFNASYTLGVDTKVVLPTVTFADTEDKELSISVKYYVDSIENGLTSANGSGAIVTSNSTILKDYYISPEKAGTYYVVYTAKDNANNSYDFVTSFVVDEEESYAIKLEYKSSVDMYEEFEIIAKVVDSEGNVDENYPVKISFNGKVPDVQEGNTVQFYNAGEYNFTATTDAPGATEVRGVITVSEVPYVWENEKAISVPTTSDISPVLEYSKLNSKPADWDTNYENYFVYNQETSSYEANTSATYEANKFYQYNEKVFVEFDVPKAYRKDLLEILGSEYATVTVKDPDSKTVDVIYVTDDVEDWRAKFEAKNEGKYTVTLTIGTLKKTFYVQVGDNEKPVVQIVDKSKVQKDVIYKGEELKYTLTYTLNEEKSNSEENIYNITIKIGNKISYQTELKLYDLDRNGNKVALAWSSAIESSDITLNKKTYSDKESVEGGYSYSWKISEVGDYELKINATDTNGVEAIAETIKFKVVDESEVKTKKDNKAGIILIVISVLVLAGIACFFAFSGKKSFAPKKVKEDKKSNDKE